MDVTPRKQAQVVALRKHSKPTIRAMGEQLGLAKPTVRRIANMAESGNDANIHRRGRCGRKRKTTASDDKMIIRNSVKAPWKTSRELQSHLAVSGVIFDPSTVRKRLPTAGRIARKPSKQQLLTPALTKKRLQWAKKYNNWGAEQWKKVIFSDQSHFEVDGYRSRYIRNVGEPIRKAYIQQATKYPPKKMFCGFFSASGPGRLIPIERMNSDKYKDILTKSLMPRL